MEPDGNGAWESSYQGSTRSSAVLITYEELNTLVIEVEAVMNDHPLTHLSRNLQEPEADSFTIPVRTSDQAMSIVRQYKRLRS